MKNQYLTKQMGASLLEVMVALFVLAVGLLGVIALQTESVKLNQQAYASSQAIFMANDAAERMRTHAVAYKNGLTPSQAFNPSKGDVFPTTEFDSWEGSVEDQVPGGTGKIDKVGGSGAEFKITITYKFKNLANQQLDTDPEDFEYVLFTQL